MTDMTHFLRSLEAKDGVDPRHSCPQCGGPLRVITSYRWGLKRERLPLCDQCKQVYRIAELGWKEDE